MAGDADGFNIKVEDAKRASERLSVATLERMLGRIHVDAILPPEVGTAQGFHALVTLALAEARAQEVAAGFEHVHLTDTLEALLVAHGITTHDRTRLVTDIIYWAARACRETQPASGWKDRLVDLLMGRRMGASGAPIFVDPVIIRGLIDDALAGKTARVDKRTKP
jgi:hypothetical protein